MIFVTVGDSLPFDRLIAAVDAWAHEARRTDVFAQIGRTTRTPPHLRWVHSLATPDFLKQMAAADVIVAHAGVGTIFKAMELRKPILVMPRRGDLRETRNDHQLATARQFCEPRGVAVAYDEVQLRARLADLGSLRVPDPLPPEAPASLIDAIRAFIDERPIARTR